MRFTNCLFSCGLLLTVLTLLQGCSTKPSAFSLATRTPNIILIISDDLGFGEVGCYGQRLIKTPNIDSLASRGMLFTDAYSGSCVCAPSRCTLLTGLHTGHSAIRDNKELSPTGQQPLPAESVTIAQLLKTRGYATAAIGKWGLGPPGSTGDPAKHGFDHFFGYLCQRHAHNHCPPHLYRDSEIVTLPANKAKWESGSVVVGASYAPDLFREEAEQFISANRANPFFLLFATPVPHAALQVPEDSISQYSSTLLDAPYDGKKGYLKHPTPHAAYAAMVSRMDRDIGHMLNQLKSLGLDNNTIVIFTSDNGPTFNGGTDSAFFDSARGLRGLKCQLYEGGIRVPLIISWPGNIPQGTTNSTVTANWDLFPTLANAAGVTPTLLPANLDGIDLSPTLFLGAPALARDHLYWEYSMSGGQQAVRIANFKAIRRNAMNNPNGPPELYDLSIDPTESNNIANKNPGVVAKALEIMAARTPSPIAEWNFKK